MSDYTLNPDEIRKILTTTNPKTGETRVMGRRQAYNFVNSLPYHNKIGGRLYVPASRFWDDFNNGRFGKDETVEGVSQ